MPCLVLILYARTKESHFFKDMVEDTYGCIIGNRILTSSHNEFVSLFGEYKELYGTNSTSELASQARASENASENSLVRSRYNQKRMRVCGDGSTSTNTRTELDKYLAEDTEELTAEFDLLEWWKLNAARFPVLSKMARDILAIPISMFQNFACSLVLGMFSSACACTGQVFVPEFLPGIVLHRYCSRISACYCTGYVLSV